MAVTGAQSAVPSPVTSAFLIAERQRHPRVAIWIVAATNVRRSRKTQASSHHVISSAATLHRTCIRATPASLFLCIIYRSYSRPNRSFWCWFCGAPIPVTPGFRGRQWPKPALAPTNSGLLLLLLTTTTATSTRPLSSPACASCLNDGIEKTQNA